MEQIHISDMAYDILREYFENELHIDITMWRFRSDTFKEYLRTMERIIGEGIEALREEKGMDAILDAQEGA